ncbi:protein kinase (Lkh1) [Cordyceps militaris CM01]|uniref:dual-specificity kinase n=1 Tax=Cordyceps militaris (strain CM01) TaxID=983644 RepID=G3JBT7_CORMM|nr:protein kinase (Lkh1) [Cordyceps militaris CM01]EGX94510.1 protein kinase (Lkh1) [Cordyceps militaris CM01]
MSTPATAVAATLPHYHHPRHYHSPYAAAHQQQYPASPGYRTAAPIAASSSLVSPATAVSNTAHLLPVFGRPSPLNLRRYLDDASALDHPPPPPPHAYLDLPGYTPATRLDDSFTSAMSSSTMTAMTATVAAAMDEHASRKRRRSKEPDWNNFYRNGLPKEIIVIDDTPEPEANQGRKLTHAHATSSHIITPDGSLVGLPQTQPAKRRRRENVNPPANYHIQPVTSSHAPTPNHNITPTASTLSSDGHHSSSHTTAATSLSSIGQADSVSTPLKRKRTRQQVAIEAKRRDIEGLGHPFEAYVPPPYPPKKGGDVYVRVVHDSQPIKNVKVDDDDGHYLVVPDADLTDKYKIKCLLGQGTFGKVVQARDRRRNEAVAVKIIRSVQKYRDASRIELRVFATLKANDPTNRNRCIHLRDCFDYRGHICIVMDLLGSSVFDFLKGNHFVPFPNSQIQKFARQLLTSVAFLHDLNLIHTDLKPENILLYDNSYQTFTYHRKIPSASTTINRQATQRRVLLDTEIRLIDFGSATFEDEYHSSVVSTRHYRAPEIILGLGWSFPCDIWSIGCILVEFFTGDALFQTHDNLEHLAMMEMVVGQRIDAHLVQAINRMSTRTGGNPASKYFKRLRLDYPTPETSRSSRRFVRAMKNLDLIIPRNTTFFKNFHDLLRKMFIYDPAQRITAREALNHPWFKEMAPPDDGTEAAKIRMEKRRLGQDAQSA